jgi:hypothetical protein
MEHLHEDRIEERERNSPSMTAKELLIKLRKDHLENIVDVIIKLRRDKYITKSIDKKVALQAQIKVLTEEYLEIEAALNRLEADE